MSMIKKIIPAMIVAVPLMGMASASPFSSPAPVALSVQADSDSVAKRASIGTVIDEVVWVVGAVLSSTRWSGWLVMRPS